MRCGCATSKTSPKGRRYGLQRGCGALPDSEHAEGRAGLTPAAPACAGTLQRNAFGAEGRAPALINRQSIAAKYVEEEEAEQI